MTQASSSAAAHWAARLLRVRWLVRSPIWLYRAHLGFVFGSRLLLLEHIGRKSGARRYVVLEVMGHPGPRTYVVASGFGERSQWLKNVRANPAVRVMVGARPLTTATARPLTGAAAAAVLNDYARQHRRAWARLEPVLGTTLGAQGDGAEAALPLMAFDLSDDAAAHG